MMSCAFGGAWFFFSGLTLAWLRVLWGVITLVFLPMTGFGGFMAWAALYTNIDAGTARKLPGQEARPEQ